MQHFVSDRKVDEDLSRTTRFLYDSDYLKRVSIYNDYRLSIIFSVNLVVKLSVNLMDELS